MTTLTAEELISALLVRDEIRAAVDRAYAAAERVMTADPGVRVEVIRGLMPRLDLVGPDDCLDDLEMRFLIDVDAEPDYSEFTCAASFTSAHMERLILSRVRETRAALESEPLPAN